MRRLAAAAVIGVLCAVGAEAQQVTGEVRNLSLSANTLTYSVRDLVFRVEDLKPAVQDLAPKVQSLAPKVESLVGKVQGLQVRETATETRIELPADILFDFDRADIRPAAQPALKQAAEVIRRVARGTVLIEGHTDSKGSAAYNQKLSERRALSVRAWLVERENLRQVRFAIKGYGAARPAAPNTKRDGSDDPAGRQKNRRVEIVIGKR